MRRFHMLAALMFLAPADGDPSSGASPTGGSPAPAGSADAAKAADGQQAEPGKQADVQEGKEPTQDPSKAKDPAKPEKGGETEPKAEPKLEVEPRETKARVELVQRAKALDAREAKVKLAEADHAELSRWRELKSMAQQDSVSVLEELGLTVEQVFKHAKEGQKIDPTARKALARAAALEKQLEADKAERTKLAEEQRAAEVRTKLDGQIQGLLKSDANRFELTLQEGKDGAEAVHDALVAYTQRTGRAPSAEDAKKIADNVEKFYRGRADRYAASNYWKSKSAPKKVDPKPPATRTNLDNTDDSGNRSKAATDAAGASLTHRRVDYLAGIDDDIKAARADQAAAANKDAAHGK